MGKETLLQLLKRKAPYNVILARIDAATAKERDEENGGLPLHVAINVRRHDDYDGVVEAVLNANPSASMEMDRHGKLPFHYAIHNTSDYHHRLGYKRSGRRTPFLSDAVVLAVLNANPDATKQKDDDGNLQIYRAIEWRVPNAVFMAILRANPNACTMKDSDGNLPLCHAIRASAPDAVVMAILNANPSAAKRKDDDGNLPLHIVAQHLASDTIVVAILEAHPNAAKERNHRRQLPLHIAVQEHAPHAIVWKKTYHFPIPWLTQSENDALDVDVMVMRILSANPNAAKQQDENGNLPLHSAITWSTPSTIKDATIMTILAANPGAAKQAHGAKELPLHIVIQRGASDALVTTMLNANCSAAIVTDNYGNLPLHIAIQKKMASATVMAILSANCNAALEKGGDGELPLHIVTQNYCSSDAVIQAVLNENPSAATKTDSDGNLPLHIAIQKNASDTVVMAILNANRNAAMDKDGDGDGKLPLHMATQNGASDTVVKAILEANSSAAQGLPDSALASLSGEAFQVLLKQQNSFLKDRLEKMPDIMLLTSKGVAEWLSLEASKRSTVFLLMLKFYLHMTWIVAFVYGTESLLKPAGLNTVWEPCVMLAVTLCFFIIEVLQFLSMKMMVYLNDPWNWIDISTILLVGSSAVCLLIGLDNNAACRLYMATGFFQLADLLSYTKNTFLSFSTFIVGVVEIFRVIIPFLFVSVWTLFAFSFMYYVADKINLESRPFEDPGAIQHTEADDLYPFSTLHSSFTNVLTTFSSGPLEDTNVLDVIFGTTVVIILLNVVIAIVSDAWGAATSKAEVSFLRHRLSLLFSTGIEQKIVKVLDEESWVAYFNGTESQDFTWVRKCCAFVKISLLAFLGVACGVFWPKFIREYMFKVTPTKTERTINDVHEKLEAKLEELSVKMEGVQTKLAGCENDVDRN